MPILPKERQPTTQRHLKSHAKHLSEPDQHQHKPDHGTNQPHHLLVSPSPRKREGLRDLGGFQPFCPSVGREARRSFLGHSILPILQNRHSDNSKEVLVKVFLSNVIFWESSLEKETFIESLETSYFENNKKLKFVKYMSTNKIFCHKKRIRKTKKLVITIFNILFWSLCLFKHISIKES